MQCNWVCIHNRTDRTRWTQEHIQIQLQVSGEILVDTVEIGVFGGTGIYDSELLEDTCDVDINTPFGDPSDTITVGTFNGRRIAFLPRHGREHTIPPHMINYKANIWAFKELGITRIIAPSAVGSLQEELAPGHFALPSQFLDFTKGRDGSFSERGRVIHISVADPFCPQLQCTISDVAETHQIPLHQNCTYACIEGPRFSTKAESILYKQMNAHIIGMTLVPECQLAREAQICYASISTITDYDAWAAKPVTAKEVLDTFAKNVTKTKKILMDIITDIPKDRTCNCSRALKDAEF